MGIARGPLSSLAPVGSGTTLNVVWSGSQPAAGSTVLVYVQNSGVTAANMSAADNGTSPATWVMDKSTTSGKGAAVFRANNITLPSAGNFTVTLTSTQGAGTIVAGGVAYTGVAAGAPTATNSGTGTGTAVSAGSVTPNNAGALYFGCFSDTSGLNPETISLNWAAGTQEFTETNGSSFWCSGCADSITGTGAQTPAWTLGDSVTWGAVAVVYDAAASSPPGVLPHTGGKTWRRRFRHRQVLLSAPQTAVTGSASLSGMGSLSAGAVAPVVGTDDQATFTAVSAAIGPLYAFRGYNNTGDGTHGVPASWPGTSVSAIPSWVQIPVITIQPDPAQLEAGNLDSVLASYFSQVPPGAYVGAWEEGETSGSFAGGTATPSQLIADTARLYRIFKANAPPTAKFGQIFSSASSYSGNSGFPLHQWLCTVANGGADLDFYGNDAYPQTSTDTVSANVAAQQSQMSTAGVTAGTPFIVAECNVFSFWTAGTWADWIGGYYSAAVSNGWRVFCTWWDTTASDTEQRFANINAAGLEEMRREARLSDSSPYLSVPPALSGAGTLSASPQAPVSGTAALSGLGTLSASPFLAGAATLSGLGTLPASPALAGTAGLSGQGTLSAAVATGAVAALSGSGTLSAAPFLAAAAALSGSGTLGASWTARAPAALSGVGTLSAAPGGAATAALAGTGTLSVAPAIQVPVALSGAGTLSGAVRIGVTAALSGTGTLSAAWVLSALTPLAGSGTLTALAVVRPLNVPASSAAAVIDPRDGTARVTGPRGGTAGTGRGPFPLLYVLDEGLRIILDEAGGGLADE